MEESRLYLGIDYGGNAVKAGLVDGSGQLAGKASWPTVDLVDESACRSFANGVSEFVSGLGVHSSELGGVGLAIPGIIGQKSIFTPNVRVDWELLIACLSRSLSELDIATVNDANAAALGETWMGAGGNARSAMFVALGSGLGAGLVVDGAVVSGGHGAAGELGHLTVVPGGRLCTCGREGCVERYASARGIVQTYREAGESGELDESKFTDYEPGSDTDALPVFKAYAEGDPRAEKALAVMTDRLGFALAQVACVVDPDVFLLGGGVAGGARYFIDDLRELYRRYCLDSCAATEIRTASLGSDAGVIGAARYAMTSAKAKRSRPDPGFGL